MTYIAVARNPQGKLGQLLVTRTDGVRKQEWTGKVYKSQREASADMLKVNCKRS